MYQRILLAYDGTREGLIALREGALLTKRCGSQVFLLSVLPETGGAMLATAAGGGDVVSQQMDSYKALLSRGVEVLTQLGLKPVGKLVIGEPAHQIAAYARETSADLIVLGHRHHNTVAHWFSESTGDYIKKHVPCSVLMGRNAVTDEVFQAELQTSPAA